jgi:outer membrane protein assembly factor BamB
LAEAENALKQGELFTFEKTLRQGMVQGSERLTGLAKLYAARGQYPIGVYTIDSEKTDFAESKTQTNPTNGIRFIRRIGDIRQVLTNTLDTVKDEQGRNYLLEDDGRIVVQDHNGCYLQTLYTDKSADHCRSLRIVKGWVMLSSEPSNRVIKPTGAALQPFADGAMHTLPDGSVGFLFASDRSSKQVGVYQITPQMSVPKLLCNAPADKRVADYCVIGKNVLFSGGFQASGSKQLALISMSLDQAGSKSKMIVGQLGQGDSVNLFGMSPTSDAGSIIVRKVNNWTRLDLVKLDLTTNQAMPFFDMQAHLKLKGHENIYNIVKHFPPWELAYRIERYPDGSGYALLVSPLCTVYRLDAQGNVKWAAGIKAEGSGQPREWSYPSDISVDHKGRLWVVDRDTSQIDMLDASGKLLANFGHPGRLDDNANDAFWQPEWIAVTSDAQGRDILYVGDTGNGRMVEFEIQ